ncbi:MAG: UvrD-helicase domain-containing protein [Deltaproteobacteria bacterium]|uniref:DNA 3'-5' helicase n=1 Tax=Candidatus Zymogenus saltonus TaxID=2844893 RepID=A0A9D8PNB2_9DELT|nr:UvrD-helicase domain-containing protein [Candidatus Zymogenus saltonus]
MDKILKNLNDTQREVVTFDQGPALVLAGAGSGKTRVLTHRIAYLVASGIHPDRILAVTFTNKAAKEMRERASRLIPSPGALPWITTFHSACLRILRIEAKSAGLNPNFVIYDSTDQVQLMRRILKDLDIGERSLSPQGVLYAIEIAKNRLMTPDLFRETYQDPFSRRTARVYARYQEELKKSSALDFSDLIMGCVILFDENPQILDKYRERFIHLLVDEYQDTNFAQYELIKRLVSKHRNLCVVGDDDQSIYRWRGADLGNILDFENDFPDCVVFRMEKNYRSTKSILAASGSVVEKNTGRKGKTLYTDNEEGNKVVFFEGYDDRDETGYAVRTIAGLMEDFGYDAKDFAIFYRTNAQSRPFEDELMGAGIPYQVVGGMRFYERMEIKDVVAYLRLAGSPDDAQSFLRIVNVPPRGVGAKTIEKIEELAKEKTVNLVDASESLLKEGRLSKKAADGIDMLLKVLKSISESDSLYGAAMGAVFDSGMFDYYRSMGTVEAEGRIENLNEFITAVSEFEEKNPDAPLSDLLDQIALVSDVDGLDDVRTRVSLLTIHSAKGLEFPVVIIAGMEEGLFPHGRSLDTIEDIEEERRLCYVGMTRAKERLYLTSARRRRVFGTERINSVSRFVHEVDRNYIETAGSGFRAHDEYKLELDEDYARENRGITGRFDKIGGSTQTIAPGVRIKHPDFGYGIVKGVEEIGGRLKLTVLFSGYGIKKVISGYVPIEIV